MTQAQLYALLTSTGISFRYSSSTSTNAVMPYGTYRYKMDADLKADNKNYYKRGRWDIGLYTKDKSPATEKLLEDVLDGAKIPYAKFEYEPTTETPFFQFVYEITV